MAQGKKSFVLYSELYETVDKLPDEIAGKVFKTILEYVNDKDPQPQDLIVQVVFEPVRQHLKRHLKDWEQIKLKRTVNGQKGGLKSGESRKSKQTKQMLQSVKQNEAKGSNTSKIEANEAVNVNGNVNVNENVTSKERANALVVASADDKEKQQLQEYDKLIEPVITAPPKDQWPIVKQFVIDKRPTIPEPYKDLWNLFVTLWARGTKIPTITALSDQRKKHLAARIKQPDFDFCKILDKIFKSEMLRGEKPNATWTVNFDFIIESKTNFLKILEGNYDNK